MKRIARLKLQDSAAERIIELYAGDIAAISKRHQVDVLGVSAFPSDYTPTMGSVIGALSRRGVSVEELADDIAEDLRGDFGCWLSRDIKGKAFARVVCFEPRLRGRPDQVIGDFFRGISALSGGGRPIASLAIPIFAAGDQEHPVSVMLHALLKEAQIWMTGEFPLRCLRIVVTQSNQAVATELFAEVRRHLDDAKTTSGERIHDAEVSTDIVLSAAPDDSHLAVLCANVISAVAPDLRIYRTPDAPPSPLLARAHFERLDRCRRVLALVTPGYLKSKACQEDLCIARFRASQTATPLLFPLLLEEFPLPPSIRVLRMVPCSEARERTLRMVCAVLAIQLQGLRQLDEGVDDTTALAISSLARLLGSPVLGTSRRHSDAGTPGTVSRESLLLDLALDLFSADEFRIFLRHLPGGLELRNSLPSPTSLAPLVFFDAAIEAMSRRGLLNMTFFTAFLSCRPLRSREIRVLASHWGCTLPHVDRVRCQEA